MDKAKTAPAIKNKTREKERAWFSSLRIHLAIHKWIG